MKEIREMSDNGIQKLIQEEGLVKRPYRDQKGIPTIGVGMTYYPDTGEKVKMTDPALTTERVLFLLRMMVKNYELGVYSNTRDDINQNQFDAQSLLCYNIGVYNFKGSTLVRRVNQNPNQVAGITEAFLMWKNAGGKPILLGRRKREVALYFTTVSASPIQDTEQVYINQVRLIQTKLKLDVDGIFGKKTKAAVMVFQEKHGLIVDGIAGPQTMLEINKLP